MTKCTNNTCILSTKCLRYLKQPFIQSLINLKTANSRFVKKQTEQSLFD